MMGSVDEAFEVTRAVLGAQRKQAEALLPLVMRDYVESGLDQRSEVTGMLRVLREAEAELDAAETALAAQEEPWGHELGMLGHKIATEAARRLQAGEALGKPNLYNIIRETVIDVMDEER